MKILFVAARFPQEHSHGDRVRAYHHIRVLARDHEVTAITPEPAERDNGAAYVALRPHCKHLEVVTAHRWRGAIRMLGAPFSSLPLQTILFFDPRVRKKVQSLVEDGSFDLIHVQLVRMAPVIDGLLKKVPAVLDLIDALSVNMARRASRERLPARYLSSLEATRLRAYERTVTSRYEEVIVSSPVDRAAIGEYANLHVIPNGVEIDAANLWTPPERRSREIVFTGNMWYFPNVDAISWFVNNAFDEIKRRIPDVQLVIAGAKPTAAVRKLGEKSGVNVTGYVPSVREYLHRSAVAIAPMQSGSGMQFKVIEAMASGTPVVATPFALGGLEAIHGTHLLVASDAATFAAHVVRLLEEPELGAELARNAGQLVKERYSWDRTVVSLQSVYAKAVSR